jgi:hypothetical protein
MKHKGGKETDRGVEGNIQFDVDVLEDMICFVLIL